MQHLDEHYLREAISLAREGMEGDQGGPFGCVIVKDGQVIARGNNRVTSTNDPTAHAEMVAIREACDHLGEFQLTGCTLYTSCEPCPMCLGAIRMSRMRECHYASEDPIAGSAIIMEATPFMRELNIKMVPPSNPMLDDILATLLIECLLYAHAKQPLKSIPVRQKFFPKAGALAGNLFESGDLKQWAKADIPTAQVVNSLASRLR